MAYIPASSFVPHFHRRDGSLAVGCILSAFVAQTTTPTPLYLDVDGAEAGTTITLNDRGEPEVSGNTVVPWLDTEVAYKFTLTDPEDGEQWTVDDITSPIQMASTTAPGIVQLYDDIDSERDDLAATANAVRIAAVLAQQAITIASSGLPVGAPLFWPTATVPSALWQEEDGGSLAVDEFPEYFAVVGYMYGGAGANFNKRDMRGRFPRGWDHGAGRDPDRASRTNRGDGTTGDNVGTNQDHAYQGHAHPSTGGGTNVINPDDLSGSISDGFAGGMKREAMGSGNGNVSTETRSVNINGMWIVKVQSTVD